MIESSGIPIPELFLYPIAKQVELEMNMSDDVTGVTLQIVQKGADVAAHAAKKLFDALMRLFAELGRSRDRGSKQTAPDAKQNKPEVTSTDLTDIKAGRVEMKTLRDNAKAIGDTLSIQTAPSLILLGVLISLAHFGDWSYLIPAWTIIFFCYYKRDTKKMIVLFAVTSVTLQTLVYAEQYDSLASFSFQYGTLFALIPIMLYNGERGKVRHKRLNRWFFYIFYPAHMIILMAVKALLQ